DAEDVGGSADPQRRVEAQWFLEPDLTSDLSEHSLPPVPSLAAIAETREELDPELPYIAGPEGQHQIVRPGGLREVREDALAIAVHVDDFPVTVRGNPLGQVAC